MENINKKVKKSAFIHGMLFPLNEKEQLFHNNLKKIFDNESKLEIVAYLPGNLSIDGQERSLVLSREIIDKIQFDHGNICIENLIINAHEWEFAIKDIRGNPEKINLIKIIPNSDNYLLIAANRDNGFYMVTHFETETSDHINLQRLLGRGSVVNRGAILMPSITDQGIEPAREGI